MIAAPQPAMRSLRVRDLRRGDLPAVVRIDGLHTGRRKARYWAGVFADFLGRQRRPGRVGLAAEDRSGLAGYLLGEVRAFEFGSEACGWIFAVGVDPRRLREGIASALLNEGLRRFEALGVESIRTMVSRNNVPVLSFFRSNGFVGGPFVQLEHGRIHEPSLTGEGR